MIHDSRMLADLVKATSLDGAGFSRVEAAPEVLLVHPGRDLPVLEMWRVLRTLVDQTGRWPVAVSDDDGGHWCVETATLSEGSAPDTVWPWHRCVDDLPLHADEVVLEPPLDRSAGQSLQFPTTRSAVDRWTYERIPEDPSLKGTWRGSPRLVSTDTWFRPRRVAYALLPTTVSWQAQSWLSYFGALDPARRLKLLAALREWSQRWGAELVASWGTILQLIVARRPTDPEDCWEVAGQLKAVGGSLQMGQHDLALALPHGDAWFVHDRP